MQAQRLNIGWVLTLWALLASAGARAAESATALPEFRVSGPSAAEFVAGLNAACREHLGTAGPRIELAPGLEVAAGPDRLGFTDLGAVFLECTPEQIVRLACTALDLPWGAEAGRLVVGSGTGDTREQRFQLSPRFFEHYAAAGDTPLRDFLQARALILPPSVTVAVDREKSELVVMALGPPPSLSRWGRDGKKKGGWCPLSHLRPTAARTVAAETPFGTPSSAAVAAAGVRGRLPQTHSHRLRGSNRGPRPQRPGNARA